MCNCLLKILGEKGREMAFTKWRDDESYLDVREFYTAMFDHGRNTLRPIVFG